MSQAPAPWIHGTEPARPLWALGAALTLTAVAVDHVLSGHLTFFFDVCFIATCTLLAFRITPGQFTSAAAMPPVLMLGVLVFLSIVSPATIADQGDGFIQALVSGLAHHAVGFAFGFAAALGVLQYRDTQAASIDDSPDG